MDRFQFRHIETYAVDGMCVEKHSLPNGLVVLYQHQPKSPVVSYQTWFRVGSRDDGSKTTGLAHLFEHLMFLGTAASPAGEYDRLVEARGGRVNAATWLDWTYYDVDVPVDLFPEIARLEADRLTGLSLTPEVFEAEREVVLNERREQVEDDPDGILVEKLWEQLFPQHPYGAPTIGYTDHIKGLTLDRCLEFYGARYAPDQACICISGGIQIGDALDVIAQEYGAISSGQWKAGRPHLHAAYPCSKSQKLVMDLPLAAERILIGFALPGILDTRCPALEVLNELLLEGDSSLLYRRCVSEGELASTIYGDLSLLALGGAYEIGVDLRPGVPAEKAESVVTEALREFAQKPVSSGLLRRARNQLETRTYRNLQTAHQRAVALGFWELTAGDFKGAFRLVEQYRQVTPENVMSVCSQLLDPQYRQVVIGRQA